MQRDRNSVQEESLRAFLRKKRLEKGYSQLQLSLMLDNTRTFVSKYEAPSFAGQERRVERNEAMRAVLLGRESASFSF